MTHQKMLEKLINSENKSNEMKALIAIVDLHHPIDIGYFPEKEFCCGCSNDDSYVLYPCLTIEHIQNNL